MPVGEDQRQHLELTRDLAQRFNARYGDTFTVPEPYIVKETAKIFDLQDPTAKMSKSAASPKGLVNLLDEPRVSAKKIRSARSPTPSARSASTSGTSRASPTCSRSHAALTGRAVADLEHAYDGKGYGDLKKDLAELVTETSRRSSERTEQILAEDPGTLDAILAEGAEKARSVAAVTLADGLRADRVPVGQALEPATGETRAVTDVAVRCGRVRATLRLGTAPSGAAAGHEAGP